jgi:hypothetical protein
MRTPAAGDASSLYAKDIQAVDCEIGRPWYDEGRHVPDRQKQSPLRNSITPAVVAVTPLVRMSLSTNFV